MSSRRVRIGSWYRYEPVMFDVLNPPVNVSRGDVVQVKNMHGCPPANTMGMCYVFQRDGSFGGMVCTNSLIPVKKGASDVSQEARVQG
jgi:hypothetical protein